MRNTWFGIAALLLLGCGEEPTAAPPEELPIPPVGPHYSVSPIPLDKIARISPLGSNNKIFPVAHTYWSTCDRAFVLPTNRPCVREPLSVSAPGGGVIRALAPGDGYISVEGPPGLIFTMSHVTPEPSLTVGAEVTAGQVIATMFQLDNFDFGVINYGITHDVIVPERYPEPSLHGQHPIEQFSEPLRSQLLGRIPAVSDPLGRLAYDVAGTASGGWFREGSPKTNAVFEAANLGVQLWLGRYVERNETRILTVGDFWPGMTQQWLHVVDAAAPSWEEITEARGAVSIKLWNIDTEGRPNPSFPMGTLLVEVLSGNRLRVEWFDTHAPVAAFTTAARLYER
jgi:hypothetical protein